jgi:lysophospholipase L1-like esterase
MMKLKFLTFRIIIIVCVLTLIVLSDIIYGYLCKIQKVRKDYIYFHNAVVGLNIYTKQYPSNINIELKCSYRPEGEIFLKKHEPLIFRTDDKGYIRTGNLDLPPPELSKKILFLGGSTTECFEVDESFRFVSVIEKNLNKNTPVRCYNGGVRGHTTADSITSLFLKHREIKPYAVILMENINDRSWIEANGTYKPHKNPTLFLLLWVDFLETLRSRSNFGYTLVSGFANKSWLQYRFPGDHVPSNLNDMPLIDTDSFKFLKSKSYMYGENITIFIETCRSLGAIPIIMLQPLNMAHEAKEHDYYNEVAKNVCIKKNAPFISLPELLPTNKDELFFSDGIHLNNVGSLTVGEIVSQKLLDIIQKPSLIH